MGLFRKLAGIIGVSLQLDVVNGGPRIANEAGKLAARDAGNTSYAVVRGDGTTVGANDLRPWASFSKSYWIDPAAGNDANPGTQASPFRTWDGGLWPAVRGLIAVDVTVTQTSATADTSVATSYQLPPYVHLTLVGPWADTGLGTKTSTGASDQFDLVVTGGGLVVNSTSGRRVRWLAGSANAGGVYICMSNDANTILPGFTGYENAPLNGDQFVVEQQVGGWKPASFAQIDATAVGACFDFTGWKLDLTNAPIAFTGNVHWAGLEVDCGGTANQASCRAVNGSWGFIHGGFAPNVTDPIGSLASLGCYFHGGTGLGGVGAFLSAINSRDLVFLNAVWSILAPISQDHESVELHGTTTQVQIDDGGSVQFVVVNQVGANAVSGGVFLIGQTASNGGAQVGFSFLTIDTALATDAVNASFSRLAIGDCTGTMTAASKFGVRAQNNTSVQNLGGNSMRSSGAGGGAVELGSHAGQGTWPAAGTLVTDLADPNSQGCVQA